MDAFACGPFTVTELPGVRLSETEYSPRLKKKVPARSRVFRAEGPSGVLIKMAVADLESAERLVRGFEARGPKAMMRLADGKRTLMINPSRAGVCYVALKQVWLEGADEAEWPRMRFASAEELNEGARLDVAKLLEALGAMGVGTKEQMLHQKGGDRNMMVATFPATEVRVPLGAYLATRVLPTYYHGVGKPPPAGATSESL